MYPKIIFIITFCFSVIAGCSSNKSSAVPCVGIGSDKSNGFFDNLIGKSEKDKGAPLACGAAIMALQKSGTGTETGTGTGTSAVETPTFSPAPGHYNSVQRISISSTTSGASIYFTLDGSTPTSSSSLYSSPLHIWGLAGKTIKAIAVKSGLTDSAVGTGGTYSYPLIKTLQTNCYDNPGAVIACAGTGQDGEFQRGLSLSLTDNGDGTVSEETTGLIWQKCSYGTNNDATCSGTIGTLNWAAATSYCSGLSLGSKVWRLPTLMELYTLSDAGILTDPIINNTTIFPATGSSGYWSSTVDPTNSSRAYSVGFTRAATNSYSAKTATTQVRCVSSSLSRENNSQNYTDNGDGTVKSNENGLVWQKCTRGLNNDSSCSGTVSPDTWSTALTYCNTLNLGGKTWRLPNRNELLSILDYTKTAYPLTNPTFFPNTPDNSFWTSTSRANLLQDAFFVIMNGGVIGGAGTKTGISRIRCVAGP